MISVLAETSRGLRFNLTIKVIYIYIYMSIFVRVYPLSICQGCLVVSKIQCHDLKKSSKNLIMAGTKLQ